MYFLSGCKGDASPNASPNNQLGVGQGGSLARFSIKNDYLYVVDDTKLHTFDITNISKPTFITTKTVGERIQTIYNYKNNLFIGSERSAYFYDITMPDRPVYISSLSHAWSCDPIVADDTLAYVTLSVHPRRCRNGLSQLDVISIKDIQYPKLLYSIRLTNPVGLAITSNRLFVCDNSVKIYKRNGNKIDYLSQSNYVEAQDIILKDSLAFVTSKDGVYIYKFKNDSLSKIARL